MQIFVMNYKVFLRLAIGIIFVISAYTKLISTGIVEIILVDHNLFSSREAAGIFVRILIGIEFAIGIFFILNISTKKLLIPTAAIFLILFTVYLIYSGVVLGDNQNCGCFGNTIPMSPIQSIIKNLVLLFMIFFLRKFEKQNEKKNFIMPLTTTIFIVVLVFVIAPVKSTKDFKFNQYTFFEGKGRVDLTDGDKFIVVLNTGCDHCQELAKELSLFKKDLNISSKIFALLYSEADVSIDSFKTLTKFDYPYNKIDIVSFFNLIDKNPPRIYWLKNGVVKEIWDSNFIPNIKRSLKNF